MHVLAHVARRLHKVKQYERAEAVRRHRHIVASQALALTVGAALLAGCSSPSATVVEAQSSRWPEAQQTQAIPQSEIAPLPQAEVEVGVAAEPIEEAEALPVEGLCESLARPALETYLSDMQEDPWRVAMEEHVAPDAVDLTRRPITDEVEWLSQMPGDTANQVWCEATTTHNMWLIGISTINGKPKIDTLQPGAASSAFGG